MTVTPTPSMPYTTAGICTKDIDDPGSQTFVPGRLNQADRKLFKGIVSECRDHQSSEEQLQSIHCNKVTMETSLVNLQINDSSLIL